MTGPEHRMQVALCRALRALGGPRVMFWSTPNEGKRSKGLGDRMRAAGLTAGVPDLTVTWWCEHAGRARIMWLELKAPRGRLTDRQAEFHDRLRAQGHLVAVVRSVDEALTALRAERCPLAEERTA